MTAPDHLRITGPEDILGFIPHSLGYWPARSLVAMTMQGKLLGATLRVDLPGDGGSPDWSGTPGPAGFARSVASYLAADADADGSLLALFTETDGDGAPWAELLAALEVTLADAGMPVRDTWLVGADYWRNAYCLDPSCCAPPGRPVEEIRNSRLNAEMVYRGSTVGAAPGAALLTPPPGPPDPAVLEAQQEWAQLFSALVRDRCQFGQVLDVWARVLQAPAPTLSTALTGYLRATLCVPSWRDAVLVMAAAGPETAERGAEDFGVFDGGRPDPGEGGPRPAAGPLSRPPAPMPPLDGFPPPGPAPSRQSSRGGSSRKEGAGRDGTERGGGHERPEVPGYGEVLLGLAPPLPDWAWMARLDRVLEQLGAAGGEAGAAALTGRGWIEWCRGKGSFADALFRRADQEFPGYRLAELLAELVSRGTLCGWAARREAAWQRFEPDVA
ncbi:DUF4192 family protein [Arthrobacter sp. AL12]|uniref:DUF4192 family protein n=1 Tax=Arthrobacter sp. AL12 TaxID=3042241 RepID=UPI00249BF0F7|nr:DUF4192 family protein [Arthrobacter sp. AL12]MDI3213318.1 DUF4192 family protein [Arthrobacter sp. AL12]